LLQCGKGDISTYRDALMRWQLFPHGEGAKGRSGERLGAGEIVSHAIGGGAKGHYLSGFHHPRIRLHDKNGAGWSGNEASKGGEFPHAMTAQQLTKPLLCPTAQKNHLSWQGMDRGGAGKRGTSRQPMAGRHGGTGTGRPAGQRTHTTHPTRLPPDLLLGAAVNGEKYPISKILW